MRYTTGRFLTFLTLHNRVQPRQPQPASQLPPRRAGQSLQVHGSPTHTSIDTSAATGNRESTAGTQSADAAVQFDGSAPTSDWATKMSTPNRYGVLSSDDDRAVTMNHSFQSWRGVPSARDSTQARQLQRRIHGCDHHHRQQLSGKICLSDARSCTDSPSQWERKLRQLR